MTKGTLLVVCDVLGLPSSLSISSALLWSGFALIVRGLFSFLGKEVVGEGV